MWGVEFLPGTKNSLLCGTAVFEVRTNPFIRPALLTKRYSLTFGPQGMTLTSGEEHRPVEVEDIEAILPKVEDFGHTWTWGDFLLAMTFWAEGHQARRE